MAGKGEIKSAAVCKQTRNTVFIATVTTNYCANTQVKTWWQLKQTEREEWKAVQKREKANTIFGVFYLQASQGN